jgi:hypothetical protein
VQCFGIDIAPAAIEEGKANVRAAGLEKPDIPPYRGHSGRAGDAGGDRHGPVTTIFFILHEILYLGEDRLIAFLKAYQQKFPGVPLMAFEAIRPTADEMRRRPGIRDLLLPHATTSPIRSPSTARAGESCSRRPDSNRSTSAIWATPRRRFIPFSNRQPGGPGLVTSD